MNRYDRDPADPGASDDVLSRQMREAARTVGAGARLPSAAGVRARGLQRRRRRTTGLVAAAAIAVVGVVTGTSALLGGTAAPPSPATDPPSVTVGVTTPPMTTPATPSTTEVAPTRETAAPTESAPPSEPEASVPTSDQGLAGGGRSFDLFTPDGRWVTPVVEGGGVGVLEAPEVGGVPTSWLLTPVGDGAMRLETVDTIDGRTRCLDVGSDAAVGLGFCENPPPTMVLAVTLTEGGGPGGAPTMTVSSAGNYLTVVDGALTATTDPAQATVLTVVDRGPFTRTTG